MRTLGLIPARAGSKGVPGKNLRELAGRPLLAHTAAHAAAASCLDATVLSTDQEELATLGRELGVAVPFMRPAHLALDDTPMIDVVRHALLKLDDDYDVVVLLQPTCPLRSPGLIDRCWQTLVDSGRTTSCVTTVREVPSHHHPDWVFELDDMNHLRRPSSASTIAPTRQVLPPRWFRTGQVYAFWSTTARDQPGVLGASPKGLTVDEATPNIDTAEDWAFAEWLLERGAP